MGFAMNIGTLALLAPLVAGFHPTGSPAPCPSPTGGCAPAPMRYSQVAGSALPFPADCPPLGPPAPILAAKILAPAGVRVTAFPDSPNAKMFAAPSLFGFRPGYVYRMELAGLPNKPDATLYPEIEVRGSLVPRPNMNYMEYYAPIAFSESDIEKALGGALITKVIYLENPNNAVPVKTTPDKPHEDSVSTEPDAIDAAMKAGRIVAIVRLGNRKPTREDLMRHVVAGTVLLPGDSYLAAPVAPPCISWQGVPFYDPISGPKFPGEECFTDGNDTALRLGIGRNDKLGGLDPTDVAVEFTTGDKRRVTTSNRVCICVPRFCVQKAELGIAGMQYSLRAEAGMQRFASSALTLKVPSAALHSLTKPIAFDTAIRPQVQVARIALDTIIGTVGPAKAVYKVVGVQVVQSSIGVEEITNSNEFLVTKSVDPTSGVKIGDTVTFTITYKNSTNREVSDLIISDSLSGRLEYVVGSAQSDRPSNPTTEANDAGSVVVKFAIPGSIPPGQGGIVKFKAKVR